MIALVESEAIDAEVRFRNLQARKSIKTDAIEQVPAASSIRCRFAARVVVSCAVLVFSTPVGDYPGTIA